MITTLDEPGDEGPPTQPPAAPTTEIDRAFERFTGQISELVAQKNSEVLEAVKALGSLMTEHYERQQKQIDEERAARHSLERRIAALEVAAEQRDTLPSSRALCSLAAPRPASLKVPMRRWWCPWGRGE